MTADDKTERDDLLFGVRRSIRYHNRRRGFFDRYHTVTNAVSVIFGSATIFAVLSAVDKRYALIAAALVTVFSVIDLVVGTSKMARLHESLARRFIDLEAAIVSIAVDKFTPDDLRKCTTERLQIEADEPPVLRGLDSLCHNELARAMEKPHEEFVHVAWYQRPFAQFFDFLEHRIKKYKHLAT